MQYDRIDEIKKELGDKEKVSLLMLHDLKKFIDLKIEEWGTEGQYRII